MLLVVVAALAAASCDRKPKAVPSHGGQPNPSGLPVPRYVTLKFDTVNARGGPGDDYKLLWVYRTRGLPLQIVAETYDWRRVCDPEGGLAWVHKRTVDASRNVMRIRTDPISLSRSPRADSVPVATLAGRSIAPVKVCRAGWCELTVGKRTGWVKANEVWGSGEDQQCQEPPIKHP